MGCTGSRHAAQEPAAQPKAPEVAAENTVDVPAAGDVAKDKALSAQHTDEPKPHAREVRFSEPESTDMGDEGETDATDKGTSAAASAHGQERTAAVQEQKHEEAAPAPETEVQVPTAEQQDAETPQLVAMQPAEEAEEPKNIADSVVPKEPERDDTAEPARDLGDVSIAVKPAQESWNARLFMCCSAPSTN